MKEQLEMEQLEEIEKQDKDAQITEQTQQLQALQSQLEEMQARAEKNDYATQFVQKLIDTGEYGINENGQLVRPGDPNVIGNAHEQDL